MEKMTQSGDWAPVSAAPRDGTPVILWMIEDETPPSLPQHVGFWTVNPRVGIGCWYLFGDPPALLLGPADPRLETASPRSLSKASIPVTFPVAVAG